MNRSSSSLEIEEPLELDRFSRTRSLSWSFVWGIEVMILVCFLWQSFTVIFEYSHPFMSGLKLKNFF